MSIKAHFARTVSVILLLLICMSGCRKVSEMDLVGNWSLTEDAKKHFATSSKAAAILNMAGDRTFTAVEIPAGLLSGDPKDRDRQVSGGGSWSMSGSEVRLVFRQVNPNLGLNVPFGTQLHISKSLKEPVLYFFDGDPDEGRQIGFSKIK